MQHVDLDALASPLARCRADVTPLQVLQMAQAARRLRADLAQILRDSRIETAAGSRSAAGEAGSALHRARGLLGELLLRGSEHLDDDEEAGLRRMIATLETSIQDMLRVLTPPLEDTAGAEGPGQLLASLRDIFETHGLTHLRPAIAEMADYAAADELRIAVAGRTNAGKSSLINALLGMDLLPAAPIPATAVSVFIRHGEQVRGSVEFQDATPEILPSGRLAEFADARYNPSNERHVTRLEMRLPAPILQGGVCLVDLPGWDGHAPLPPCDIGLVLLDASGDLTLSEFALVEALRQAGAEVLVVLTKADRLTTRDRFEVHGRVMFELLRQTGAELGVFLAGTTSDDPALRSDWFERGLLECISRRHAIRTASMHRKLGLLRERITAARDEQRLSRAAPQRVELRVRRVRVAGLHLLQQFAHRPIRVAARAAAEHERLLDELAHNGAVLLRRSGEGEVDLGILLRRSLEARAAAALRTQSGSWNFAARAAAISCRGRQRPRSVRGSSAPLPCSTRPRSTCPSMSPVTPVWATGAPAPGCAPR